MISEEQKIDILLDVQRNVGDWVGETLATGDVPEQFDALYEIFNKAEISLKSLLDKNPLNVLWITKESAEEIGLDHNHVMLAIESWACDAKKLIEIGLIECPDLNMPVSDIPMRNNYKGRTTYIDKNFPHRAYEQNSEIIDVYLHQALSRYEHDVLQIIDQSGELSMLELKEKILSILDNKS